MKIKKLEILAIILIFINLSCITSTSDTRYRDILKDVKSGNIDFAFLKLDNYLQEYPQSLHTPQIRFAICEYYFQSKSYRNAIYKLSDYIKDYPEDEVTIFAQMLLYKILSEYQKEPLLIERIKEDIFAKPVFLIFSDSKVKDYKSALNNVYRIVSYVDKIEVFRNNDLFLKVTP